MLDIVNIKDETNYSVSKHSIWSDDLISNYYTDYYQNISIKQLDKEFNEELFSMVKVLSKLPENDRTKIIELLSRVMEFYVENKVEKEIESSFSKILKF